MSGREERPAVTRSEVLLRAPVFEVVRDTLRFPDGHDAERVVVRHPGAVALVAVDGEGRWLLVRQYRHPATRALLEIPAGTLAPGETPEQTAARELREETGFAAGSLERLGGAWMTPGFCSEYIHFFLATSLRPDPLPQDDDEQLSAPVAMTLDQLLSAVDEGAVEDAKTMVAITLWERRRSRGDRLASQT